MQDLDPASLTAEETADSAAESVSPPARSDRAAQRRSRTIRFVVLLGVLAFVTTIGYLHQSLGINKPVGVDALCPFGGIETLWSLLSGAGYIKKIAASSVVLLFSIVITAFVFRRSFCGYVCPLGALQELFGRIGHALFRGRKRPTLPMAVDRPARWLKYLVLAFFTLWTWQAAALVIRPYDPWVAWMHLTTGELFAEFGIGLAVLVVSLAGSVVYERFFCKYLCPMGAFLGVLSPVSLFKVRREADACIDCRACDKACPVNIKVSTADVVRTPECLNCNECVNVCPAAGALSVGSRDAGQLSPNAAMGWTAAIIVGVIAINSYTGTFAWTMPALARPTASGGTTVNPEDIRGSMTFAEISSATGIPAAAFEQRFGVQPSDMSSKIKDLATVYNFDVHTDVRGFVAEQIAAGAVQSQGVGGAPAAGSAPAGGSEGSGEDCSSCESGQ